MPTSKLMREIITKIAQKHDLDLTAELAHLRLDMHGYDRLVIEKIEKHLVSVAHYFEQNGDLMADPEIVFFTGYGEWVPVECTQVIGGYHRYAELSPDGKDIVRANLTGQQGVAALAKMWATNLKVQGWLEYGQKKSNNGT